MQEMTAGTLLANRYRLVERVGQGGFGETWLATDELLEMKVAIKLFLNASEEQRARYLREARALAAQASSPGAVAIRDLISTQDAVLLIMEYVDGQDLAQMIAERGRLTMAETLKLLAPVADTLSRMHASDFLHRDVSPDNIRVTRDGAAKLLDFGSSLSRTAIASATIVVKPGYAPAEQYASPADQGPWTDVYALAATIYHCVTGRAPMDALQRTFHDDLPVPSAMGADTTPRADAAIMDALAPDYRKRTQSVGTLVGELRAGLVEEAPVAPVAVPEPVVVERVEVKAPVEAPATPEPEPVAPAPEPEPVKLAPEPEEHRPIQLIEVPAQATASSEPAPAPAPAPAPIPVALQVPQPAEPPAVKRETTPATPAPQHKERHTTKPRRRATQENLPVKRSGSGFPKALIAALAVIAALTMGILVLRVTAGSDISFSSSSSESSYVSFRQQPVDATVIQSIKSKGDVSDISMSECEVTNDAIAEMAKLPALKYVDFYKCAGFTDLGPLAANEAVKSISISYSEVDGNKLFATDFPYLEYLTIHRSKLTSDMSFASHLTALQSLDVSENEGISDVEFLHQVPTLTKLNVSALDLSGGKAAPIASCTNLQSVTADACGMEDLEWASGLGQLYTINASYNAITSVEPLATCPELGTLRLNANQVDTLAPLAACTKLSYVEVVGNKLTSLTGLEGATRLNRLLADHNALNSADELASCEQLDTLGLSNNQIASLEGIADCQKLRRLDVSHNQVANLDFCEKLIRLEELDASYNQISDISKLSTCSKMVKLALQHNQISDISALGNGFVDLRSIDVSTNAITSLAPLADSSKIESAAVYENQLTSLDGMQNKPDLEALLADGNQLRDISALSTSTGILRYLDLGNNQITDVSALSSLFSKSEFDVGVFLLLDHNQLTSVDAIAKNPNYYLITVFGNPLTSISFLGREGMRWTGAYVPYIEGTDYAEVFSTQHISAPISIVGAPYDKQARLLDDAKSWYFEPQLLSEEEADRLAEEKRNEIKVKVSGETKASTGSEEAMVNPADEEE